MFSPQAHRQHSSDDKRYVENLDCIFCWVADTQMIRSTPWAVLALAAQQTRIIRLGTDVAVVGLRLALVTANGIPTLNLSGVISSYTRAIIAIWLQRKRALLPKR